MSGTRSLNLLQAAFVVARRDFSAVILSKTFILFLIGPLIPVLFGVAAGGLGSRIADTGPSPAIGTRLNAAETHALNQARDRLERDLGKDSLPSLKPVTDAPRAALERPGSGVVVVLSGSLATPVITGKANDLGRLSGDLKLMIATARTGGTLNDVTVETQPVAESRQSVDQGRLTIARGAQMLLFLLTMLLAGMVLSNLVEEKTNKIMEILAAAIPIDAVFLGKLAAMLAMSLVGITCWAGIGSIAMLWLGIDVIGALPSPAVGWPAFVVLTVLYFSTAYTLLGAMFIGIGAQASTVREVQTLSMPVTMAQVIIFFLATYAVDRIGSAPEIAAVLFPISSPFAMIARAAQEPAIWPHVLALAWQSLWVAIIIRLGVRLFRRTVLKSGGGGGGWFRRGSGTAR